MSSVERSRWLFSAGASKDQETIAAEALAKQVQLNLLRIDLSHVVSKYIGETETHLDPRARRRLALRRRAALRRSRRARWEATRGKVRRRSLRLSRNEVPAATHRHVHWYRLNDVSDREPTREVAKRLRRENPVVVLDRQSPLFRVALVKRLLTSGGNQRTGGRGLLLISREG